MLVAGDEFGDLGRMPGSDSLMLVPELRAATVFSVGVEPNGVPRGVLHRPGGPPRFVARAARPAAPAQPTYPASPRPPGGRSWSTVSTTNTSGPSTRGSTLADGVIGTSGAPLLASPDARQEVLAGGVYDDGSLLSVPSWATLDRRLAAHDRVRRTLDLHTATLAERVRGDTDADSVRFSSLAAPGLAVLRADVSPAIAKTGDTVPFNVRGSDGGVAVAGGGCVARTSCRTVRCIRGHGRRGA